MKDTTIKEAKHNIYSILYTDSGYFQYIHQNS